MFWSLFQDFGFYLFIILTAYFVAKKQFVNLLVLHFWALAFATCYKFAITIWTPDKIVDFGIVFCVLFYKGKKKSRAVAFLKTLLICYLVILIIGNLNALASTPRYEVALSRTRRLFLQDMAYGVALILMFFGRLLPEGFVQEFYKKYCTAIEWGAIIPGLVHYVFNRIGLPFMPIMRVGGVMDYADEVRAQFGESIITRVYAFAGEPKGLAYLIVPYLAIVLVCFLKGGTKRKNWTTLLFLTLGLFVLFETYSSSAFITFILLLPFILFYCNNKRSKFAVGALIVTMFLFAGILVRDVVSGQYRVTEFIENVYGRSFDRGMSEMEEGRQEAVILDAYKVRGPIVWILGWGLAQYTFNAPNMVNERNQLIPVQSGFVVTLADFGIVGIVVLLILGLTVIRLLNKTKPLTNPLPLAMAMAVLAKYIESLSHGSLVTCLFFLMIATYAYFDYAPVKSKVSQYRKWMRS